MVRLFRNINPTTRDAPCIVQPENAMQNAMQNTATNAFYGTTTARASSIHPHTSNTPKFAPHTPHTAKPAIPKPLLRLGRVTTRELIHMFASIRELNPGAISTKICAETAYLIHDDSANSEAPLVLCFAFSQGRGHWMLHGLPRLFSPAHETPKAFAATKQGRMVALTLEHFKCPHNNIMSTRNRWHAIYSLVREANSTHERAEPIKCYKLK